jgi:uncharacterized protein with HEPN domain
LWRDPKYLLDMLLAARDVQSLASGLTREDLEASRLHQLALVKAIEIAGEAARQVSAQTRAAHPEIPWQQIVGMRHRLVHDYNRIDLDIVWRVAQAHIPELIAQLEPLVPPDEPPDDTGGQADPD